MKALIETNKNIYKKCEKYKVITFDVFNTLINRQIFKPNDVLELLDYIVSLKFNLPLNSFLHIRKKASAGLAKKLGKVEFTYDDLYSKVKEISNWKTSMVNWIKNAEIKLDISLSIPRKDVIDIFNNLVKAGKKIYIVSDMYYSKQTIIKFLKLNGINGYKDVLVSSDQQAKKSDGSIWKKINNSYHFKYLHIGDSLKGDYLQAKMNHNSAIMISSSQKQAQHSKYACSNKTIEEKIINGLIFNKCLFNSPFVKKINPIDSPYKYGYSILGPLFLYFFVWLTDNFSKHDKLFLSRDGYFLEKMYVKFCKKLNISHKTKYLLTSRKVTCVANLYDLNSIYIYRNVWFQRNNNWFF